jgi:hypothetical protein
MAICGWCRRSGLTPDAEGKLPEHPQPTSGHPCNGLPTYRNSGITRVKRNVSWEKLP